MVVSTRYWTDVTEQYPWRVANPHELGQKCLMCSRENRVAIIVDDERELV